MVDSALSNMHIMLTGEHLNALCVECKLGENEIINSEACVVLVRLLISSRVSN